MSGFDKRTAVVLAGGGERVIAWQIGVLAGLADAGVDLRLADRIVGTSAGSHVAARLARGEDMRGAAGRLARRDAKNVSLPESAPFEQLARHYAAAGTESEARRRVGALALSRGGKRIDPLLIGLGGWRPRGEWPASLQIVTVDAERGERVVLDGASGTSIPIAVAASRAVPGFRRPVRLRHRKLMDGAIGSATNADVAITDARPADRVVIVAALPDEPHHPTLAELSNDALRRELAELDAAGAETYVVRATAADLEAMGPDPMSARRASLAVAAGRRAGRVVGPALRDDTDLASGTPSILRPRRTRAGKQRLRPALVGGSR